MMGKKIKVIKSIFLLIIVTIAVKLSAQDISFDQYLKSPTYLNPALTGVISGNYRIATTYHSQWLTSLNSGINAFIASGDVKFEKHYSNKKKDIFGIGLEFINDNYSAFNLSTKSLSINTAYHKQLDVKKNQFIGIGFKASVNQRNINYENLSFEDQFNQIDGYTNSSQEFLPTNNVGYLDFSTGIFYTGNLSSTVHLNLGLSYNHMSSPNLSYYKDVKNPITSLIQNSEILSKLNIHSSATVILSEMIHLIPDLLFQKQGSHQSLVIGSRIRFALNYEDVNNSLTFGTRAKFSKNSDGSGINAIILLTDYKLKNLNFGFSYNIMLTPIIEQQINLSTFEFSLKYTGQYNTDEYYCPEF